jgi:pimeloyl-ACP methyl ester carboxylesterase
MPAKNEGQRAKRTRREGYASVNGLRMYYEIHGEGKPLVLIHGGGSTIQTTFGNIRPLLAKRYQVIAVELQAHGHTKDRDTPESFEQDANDVAGLLNFLKINKADVFGFSNGGQTAMQMGISYPGKVNRLILASAFYKRDGVVSGFFEGLENAALADMPTALKEAYLQIGNDAIGLQRMFDKDRARMLQFRDWKDEDLASIQAPCLIIAGDKDIVTPEHAVEMSRKIRNAQLLILPGNHGSYIGEAMSAQQETRIPALTVAVIEEFLDEASKK